MKRILLLGILILGFSGSTRADSETGFFEEIRKGNLESASNLLSLNLIFDLDSRGRNAVFYAIESRKSNVLKFVLEKGGEANRKDNSGEYPIHFAARQSNARMITLLVDYGADINATNRYNENALDIALQYRNTDVADILIGKGLTKPLKSGSSQFTIALYISYLIISILMTIWVARTLYKNGRIFLVQMFNGEEKLADSVNHLLVVGFYLINIGYISLSLTTDQKPLDLAECIEVLTKKVGTVLLILGAMHFFNLFLFSKFRKKKISNTFGET
ncbi:MULTISPECIES: ankyrin repeat domain-containing protein [unclassified Leptospira]|uniref:ankyrin repeat domain-containing protein n=1 Tax=unclassified Leptospira TaxID=2633828 RepID=UPI000517D24C|nr:MULTISPECIES: ankyrin repeat domain-containing protein [unclassified Leptospira]